MESEIVNFELLQKRRVEDSLSSELSIAEEHFEATLRPTPKVICCFPKNKIT